MSVTYLKVFRGRRAKSGIRCGTLQIHWQYYKSDLSFGWEWYGGPEGIDGGTCEWTFYMGNASGGTSQKIVIELYSPNTKMNGVMHAYRWDKGPVPPTGNWFSGSTNLFAPYDHSLVYNSPKIPKLENELEDFLKESVSFK